MFGKIEIRIFMDTVTVLDPEEDAMIQQMI